VFSKPTNLTTCSTRRGWHGRTRRLPLVASFDHVVATFWSGGMYGMQQPLADEMVREAEQVLGVPSRRRCLICSGSRTAAAWRRRGMRPPLPTRPRGVRITFPSTP